MLNVFMSRFIVNLCITKFYLIVQWIPWLAYLSRTPIDATLNLERYTYFTNSDYLNYEFFSEGPKGKVKKIVCFTKIKEEEPLVYNLAFGDVNDETGLIDDGVITNNADRDIVLATVANTVIDFTNHHGNHYIYARGSTPARTRLYQIGISGLLEDISTNFEVYGLRADSWHAFERNVNYEAFLIKRK